MDNVAMEIKVSGEKLLIEVSPLLRAQMDKEQLAGLLDRAAKELQEKAEQVRKGKRAFGEVAAMEISRDDPPG